MSVPHYDFTFTVRIVSAPDATRDMVERELGAILADALNETRHIAGYEVWVRAGGTEP